MSAPLPTSLCPNTALIPAFELVAVCDLVEEKARLIADHYGAPHLFSDVGQMLEALELDGVCICGSHEMHHDVALQVLSRGIPVFTERPPAATTSVVPTVRSGSSAPRQMRLQAQIARSNGPVFLGPISADRPGELDPGPQVKLGNSWVWRFVYLR